MCASNTAQTACKEFAEKLPRFTAHIAVSARSGEGLGQLVECVCKPPERSPASEATQASAGTGAPQAWCSVM